MPSYANFIANNTVNCQGSITGGASRSCSFMTYRTDMSSEYGVQQVKSTAYFFTAQSVQIGKIELSADTVNSGWTGAIPGIPAGYSGRITMAVLHEALNGVNQTLYSAYYEVWDNV